MRAPASVSEGEILTARRVGPITQTDIVRFAGAGGDFNPLHHDPAAAHDAGFPAVIAMGQLAAGILASWVSDLFGIEHLQRFSVRFTAPVQVGDTLELTGRVTGLQPNSGGQAAELDLAVTAAGTAVVTGDAVVRVASF